MDWLTCAKQAIFSVRSALSKRRTVRTPKVIRWDSFPPLKAAINQALAGSLDTHRATQAAGQAAQICHYLIIADTSLEAEAIHALVALAMPGAKTTVRSLQADYSEGAGAPLDDLSTEMYDAAFVSLPDDVEVDQDAFLERVSNILCPSGFVWFHLRIFASIAQSPHTKELLEAMLRQVPLRWRASEMLEKMETRTGFSETSHWLERIRRANFDITCKWNVGGTLLGPLFASGAILPDMTADVEGAALLLALYRVEHKLIESGEVPTSDIITVARHGLSAEERIRRSFEAELEPLPYMVAEGISGDLQEWIAFNLGVALTSALAADHAAPFPPTDLMYHTTGLQQDRDFAQHGADILTALSAASPKRLNEFTAMLDFGVGVGRVARYFKGFAGRYVGADIDAPNLDWVAGHLPWVEPVLTEPAAPLPLEPATFDGVVSISVFTHIDRETAEFYVDELHRLTQPGALLFLTLHGDQALNLALSDADVGTLVGISTERLEQSRSELARDGFHFAEQYTHLTRANYRYGTTFVSQQCAEAIFGRRFKVVGFVPGAIHAFQDLIVLERP